MPARTAVRVPDTSLVRRARKIDRVLAETYPDARCELDFDNPFELLVVTVLSAQTTDRRVNAVAPTLFAAYPDAAGDGRRPTGRSWSRSSAHGLLPGQDRVAAQAVAGAGRAARRRGAAAARRPGHAARASAARPPTWCSATRSASPASPSTPTSAGWSRRFGWTEETDPVKVEHAVGALFPKRDWTMLQPPPDLARPAGLPRPQAGLRRLPGRALVPGVRRGADRPGRGGEAGADRGPGVRRAVAAVVPGSLPAPAAAPLTPTTADPTSRRSARRSRRGHPELRATEEPRPASSDCGPAQGQQRRCPRDPALPRRRAGRRPVDAARPAGGQPLGAVVRAVPGGAAVLPAVSEAYAGRVSVLGIDYHDTQPEKALELLGGHRRHVPAARRPAERAAARAPFPRITACPAASSSTATARSPMSKLGRSRRTPSSRTSSSEHLGVARDPTTGSSRSARRVTTITADELSRYVPPEGSNPRQGAVLMLFGEGPDGPDLLLTERAHHMRSHPGQVSFPGGSVDPTDDGATAAALREAQEETGLDPSGVEVFGELPAAVAAAEQLRGDHGAGLVARAEPGRRGRPGRGARGPPGADQELLDPAHRVTTVHPSGWLGPAFLHRRRRTWCCGASPPGSSRGCSTTSGGPGHGTPTCCSSSRTG